MNVELVKMFSLFHICLKHNFFAKEQMIYDYTSIANVKMKVIVVNCICLSVWYGELEVIHATKHPES